jgi:hypothetical protein
MAAYEVVYGDPGGTHRIVERDVFQSSDGRILGSETTEHRWFEGEMRGWRWKKATTDTRHFLTWTEASAWIDDLIQDHLVARVSANGGTKIVFVNP